jgi:hypothetical protein
MGRPAIYEPAITQLVADGRAAVAELHEAEEACRKLEKKLGEGREAAQMRRLELGRLLVKVRAMYPRRGTAEAGWKAYLEAIEVDDSTAHRWMEMVKNPAATSHEELLRRSEGPQPDPDAPIGDEDDAGPELARDQGAPVLEPAVDRDTWCTPKWITEALGQVDLDPCSNERSTVRSKVSFRLERGEDGLERAPTIGKSWSVFLNPPYSDVSPWIQAYGHTRFVFLLKFDPSTKWFEDLIAKTALVLFPRRTRVEFEAPPGVEHSGSNPFPHALFFAKAEDATEALLERCYVARLESTTPA